LTLEVYLKKMGMRFCFIFLVWAICQNVPAQGYDALFQYFEADSTDMPGYSSIKVQTTQSNTMRRGATGKVTVVESFYDPSGKLVEEEQIGGIEAPTIRTSLGYDSIFGRINYIVRTGGKVKQEAFAQYDGQGRLSEIVYCEEDKPCQVRHYDYDEDNTERLYIARQTVELQLGKGDKPKTIFGISAANTQKDELVRERFYSPEGKLEEVRVYSNGKLTKGWTFDYGVSGRLSHVWAFNSNNKKLASTSEYDEAGRLKSEVHFVWVDDGKITLYEGGGRIKNFEYDAKNRLVRIEENNSGFSKIQEFTYYEN